MRKKPEELRVVLEVKEAIFMEGGNTFYLLKCIRESGFEEVIKMLVGKGVVYIGSSTGSYVACPTMEMATRKEHNKFNRHGVTDFTGMNLAPFLVVAHYTSDLEERLKPKISAVKYPVKLLNDRQAILVKGDLMELVEDRNLKLN